MRPIRLLMLGFLLSSMATIPLAWASEPVEGLVPPASTLQVASRVDRVVLYRGGADLRRSVTVTLEPGVHELVFTGIPDARNQGLQGLRASAGNDWTVIGVQTASGLSDAERRAFELESETWDEERRRTQARLAMTAAGLAADLRFIDSVAVRTGEDATRHGGTEALDLDVLRRQLEFVREERSRIQSAMQEVQNEGEAWDAEHERRVSQQRAKIESLDVPVARVRVAVVESGTADVAIRYLRAGASWSPVYAVRSDQAKDVMPIDFEAAVVQSTGEDWTDVKMALSSASPSSPGLPPDIRPIYVGLSRPEYDSPAARSVPDEDVRSSRSAASPEADAMVAIRNAAIVSGGTAVTYELPGLVSVATGGASSNLRIASFEAPATRVLVTRPVESEQVYLRADLVNQSGFVLLAGKAALFMEGEYVGASRIEEVPAGGGLEVWFGPDPAITVSRMVVARDTQSTGLLGGGRQTSIEYRIELRNDGAASATVEVWDRRPVSQLEDIEVRIVDASPPMADDAVYRGLAARRGLLKWVVELGPAGSEKAAKTISWTVRINRPSNLELSPIPD